MSPSIYCFVSMSHRIFYVRAHCFFIFIIVVVVVKTLFSLTGLSKVVKPGFGNSQVKSG